MITGAPKKVLEREATALVYSDSGIGYSGTKIRLSSSALSLIDFAECRIKSTENTFTIIRSGIDDNKTYKIRPGGFSGGPKIELGNYILVENDEDHLLFEKK